MSVAREIKHCLICCRMKLIPVGQPVCPECHVAVDRRLMREMEVKR